MDRQTESIFQLVKEHKGLTLEAFTERARPADTAALDAALKALIDGGYITFFGGRLYPNIRTLGIVPKGERQTAAEIELPRLTVEELQAVLQPYDTDPLYYDPYPIEAEHEPWLRERFGIDLDFEHFDYYLLCGFDDAGTEESP
ncbi:MAG TPA: hypothetical protein VHK69_03370 [Chitinophagaceae bacterium]|jgi:hypothetical protein|nr:hypothetical protein [Chitinophagaceae bacterium]